MPSGLARFPRSFSAIDTLKTSSLKSDILSGFLISLIALPLCLGISSASGAPPISGVFTAILGGMIAPFLGSARFIIKGPAAGMIVIVLAAVTDLGHGDLLVGYPRMLAVAVVAGALQIALALFRVGNLGRLMPTSVVQGMLTAIGVMIISKQVHVLLGVKPSGKEPFELLLEIPRSIAQCDGSVFLVGLVALGILMVMPLISKKIVVLRALPLPLMVLLATIPLAVSLHLAPLSFVKLPPSLFAAITFPDFSQLASAVSLKHILMFTLVGSLESLLTVSAIDSLDPQKQQSDLNRDLLATGAANTLAACLGGIPMISEVVRSKANMDSGAKSAWSNFFHGLFLLLAVALIPGLLQKIPLSALAAMLIVVGFRLASVQQLKRAWETGKVSFFLFVTTLVVTLASDLLIGVAVGLTLKLIQSRFRGTSEPQATA